MKQYDSNQVYLTLANRPIQTGRTEADFVTTEYTADTITPTVGADGRRDRVCRVLRGDEIGLGAARLDRAVREREVDLIRVVLLHDCLTRSRGR